MKDCIVDSVSKYIAEIRKLVQQTGEDNPSVVFRGEPQVFPKPCQPNLFRNGLAEADAFFEKNLFDEMKANHLTGATKYLEIAVDAQHGGFPSRLLDVSYNCLVALYFAVTPFYRYPEDHLDGEDGCVYVFSLEKMYCPTGNNINKTYEACINHSEKWFSDSDLFQKNHKLIDHIKHNPRITAQQGAFILFQGKYVSSFPRHKYQAIRIKGCKKKEIRDELRYLFGIHTGSIYPEGFNLVDEMIRKSQFVSSAPFCLSNEMTLIFGNIQSVSEYYIGQLQEHGSAHYQQIIEEAEQELYDYTLRIKSFLESDLVCEEFQANAKTWKDTYNNLIDAFAQQAEEIMQDTPDRFVEISKSTLKL